MSALPVSAPLLRDAPDNLRGAVAVQLRVHRECAPEHAGLVRAACMRDPSVLPRWHQDDRGRSNAHRGIHVQAPDGAYSRIATWTSREHWVTFTVPLAIARHREILRKHHVSPAMLREAAKVKSGYADPRTGRRCIVRPKTLASVLDVDERHVQNINRCLRELGLEVVVLTGRMLTQAERYHCWRAGSRQRGLATEVALTTPTFLRRAMHRSVDTFTPASGGRRSQNSCSTSSYPHGLAAEKKGAAPPPRRPKRGAAALAARQLARNVATQVPWLASERPGRLTPALMRFATAATPWTAQDIDAAITTHSIRTGRGHIAADTIRTRPAALLASILRELDVAADHPGLPSFTSTPPPPAESCGGADCDGYGWLQLDDGRVRACPDCSPAVRTSGELPPVRLDENGQPPF